MNNQGRKEEGAESRGESPPGGMGPSGANYSFATRIAKIS